MKISTFLLLVFAVLNGCKNETTLMVGSELPLVEIKGETMGTYYIVKHYSESNKDFSNDIETLLNEINGAVNTYDEHSLISKFNNHKSKKRFDLSAFNTKFQKHIMANILVSDKVYDLSSGHYDPTVMPLVNYWGFGYEGRHQIEQVDSIKISNILEYVGWKRFVFDTTYMLKEHQDLELDFSAVAKGYAVDEIGRMLESQNVKSYFVEIGGEVRARGSKLENKNWVIGIAKPDPSASLQETQDIFNISNISVATSGNYHNFYKVKDEVRSHTINPLTGFPERTVLLSASIFYRHCALSDALATSCMSMGMAKCIEMIENIDSCFYYLTYIDEQNNVIEKHSPSLEKFKVEL